MKTAFILLLISIGLASAQTNTNSAPIFINFTNTLGEYITNAEVVSHSANKLIYRTQDGVGGGTIRLDKLPPDLQAKFNYNPTEANKADQMDNEKRAADLQKRSAAQQAADEQARTEEVRKKIKEQATVLCARIIQRLDKGLLLRAVDMEENTGGYEYDSLLVSYQKSYDSGSSSPAHWGTGIVFLVDYPFVNQMAADDKFITLAYPAGFYKYTTVNHSENTVRRYTSSLERAVFYANQPTQ